MATIAPSRNAAPAAGAAEAGVSPLRMSARKKSGRSSSNFVLGGVLVMMLLGVFALVLQLLSAKSPRVGRLADPRGERVGTVTLSPEGEHCRRMALDNSTGKMVEVSRVRCAGSVPATADEKVRQRYSGGRLDAIRKSFSDR